jgi:hypothetical protein
VTLPTRLMDVGDTVYGEIVAADFNPEFANSITITVRLPEDTPVGHWMVEVKRVDP